MCLCVHMYSCERQIALPLNVWVCVPPLFQADSFQLSNWLDPRLGPGLYNEHNLDLKQPLYPQVVSDLSLSPLSFLSFLSSLLSLSSHSRPARTDDHPGRQLHGC